MLIITTIFIGGTWPGQGCLYTSTGDPVEIREQFEDHFEDLPGALHDVTGWTLAAKPVCLS